MKRVLVDAHYFCHRAFYTMPELSYEGVKTQVAYSFLRDMWRLANTHATEHLIFCFDSPRSERRRACPTYKANRRQFEQDAPEVRRAKDELYRQIDRLREHLLPKLGYANVFYKEGYEADDIIASVVGTGEMEGTLNTPYHKVIASSDHDVYQLLRADVSMWKPAKGESYTAHAFRKEFGIEPAQWADVKAIAGCVSDNVIGVSGVGEKTAAKFLRGELKPNSALHHKIVRHTELWQQNLSLVKLPYLGTGKFPIRKDRVSRQRWQAVLESIGTNWRRFQAHN